MTAVGEWASPEAGQGANVSPYAWGEPPKRTRKTRGVLIVAALVFGVLLVGGVVLFLATGASAAGGCGGG
jgi:hypothetical protein